MGVILDSSVVILAERRGYSVEDLLAQVLRSSGDQDAALSAVGLTELIHGIYRASSQQIRSRRELFLRQIMSDLTTYPYTEATAEIAGRIDGEQTARGIIIPFPDLLIGATALSLGFMVMTLNARHFQLIPGLKVVSPDPTP